MTLYINEQYKLPVYLPDKEEMSREEFFEFCAANKHLRIERDEENQILIMAPVGGETGTNHIDIAFAIEYWNRQTKLGKTFDSASGFELPDGSMRSPDAAWIKKEKWDNLSHEERSVFLPFAPDFLVEVMSPSDKLAATQAKMVKWIQNGTQLAWLIDSKKHITFIYRADGTVDKVEGFDNKLSGENVLPGFVFDLSDLLS
jgi:Uma2 family endonuclease